MHDAESRSVRDEGEKNERVMSYVPLRPGQPAPAPVFRCPNKCQTVQRVQPFTGKMARRLDVDTRKGAAGQRSRGEFLQSSR